MNLPHRTTERLAILYILIDKLDQLQPELAAATAYEATLKLKQWQKGAASHLRERFHEDEVGKFETILSEIYPSHHISRNVASLLRHYKEFLTDWADRVREEGEREGIGPLPPVRVDAAEGSPATEVPTYRIPKINLSDTERKWLGWAYNWFLQGFLLDVDKASKAMFDKGEWTTGFRPYDIDERILVDGNKPTLLGVMYVESGSPLIPLTHEIAVYIKKGMAVNRRIDRLSVRAMAVDLGKPPEQLSRALDLLWLVGDFIKTLSHTTTSMPGQLSRPGQLPVYEFFEVGHPVIYESYEKYEGLEQLIADKYGAGEDEPVAEATVNKILGRYDLLKALVGHRSAIEAKMKRFPFEKNVFIMMKFRPSNKALSDFIKEELEKHGLRGVRADEPEWNITRDIYNPLAVLYCCKYGLVLFDEAEEGQVFSPNVAYELGIMHYQQKDCLILKHTSLPTSPFDLLKDLHKPYSRDLEVRDMIKAWIREILEE